MGRQLMGLLDRIPAHVRAMAPDERVVAWATDANDEVVFASTTAFHFPGADGREVMAWDLMVRASWSEPELDVTYQRAPGAVMEHVVLHLVEPGSLPGAVRERITSSIVVESHVLLTGTRGVRVLARRTATDQVRWSVVFDSGLDPRDPELRRRADIALADLRAQWGV